MYISIIWISILNTKILILATKELAEEQYDQLVEMEGLYIYIDGSDIQNRVDVEAFCLEIKEERMIYV